MKKVLILAYDFPPYVSVGGLRPYSWYKYFREFGIDPVVVTRQWSNKKGSMLDYISEGFSSETVVTNNEWGMLIQAPYHSNLSNRLLLKYGDQRFVFLRKTITAFFEVVQYFFAVGPKASVYKSARVYLKENNVDAIIATGDPFVLFSYASKLSKEFSTPWIADYRDPWTNNSERFKNPFRLFFEGFLEKKIVSSAVLITTVSRFVQSIIENRVKSVPFEILPNGFDELIINQLMDQPQPVHSKLQIALAGSINQWHPIRIFLEQICLFNSENQTRRIQLNFFGVNIKNELEFMIDSEFPSLKQDVFLSNKLSNTIVLTELSKSNATLLFNNYAYMGTKIFDYLGIKRKIILCYENDSEAMVLKEKYFPTNKISTESNQLQADLIRATNSGVVVKDTAQLKEVLKELYAEFEATGQVACHSVGIENYSRKIQVKKFADIIQQLFIRH
jgi:hypothetical protein